MDESAQGTVGRRKAVAAAALNAAGIARDETTDARVHCLRRRNRR
jgi:hypothetical protein